MVNKPTNQYIRHTHNDNSPNERVDYHLQCVLNLVNNLEFFVNLALLKLQDPKFYVLDSNYKLVNNHKLLSLPLPYVLAR